MKPRLNVVWNEDYCKRCLLCVEVCPVQVLSLEMDEIIEKSAAFDATNASAIALTSPLR